MHPVDNVLAVEGKAVFRAIAFGLVQNFQGFGEIAQVPVVDRQPLKTIIYFIQIQARKLGNIELRKPAHDLDLALAKANGFSEVAINLGHERSTRHTNESLGFGIGFGDQPF